MSRDKTKQRIHLRSAFLGGIVAALIVSALPAVAAQVGDALRLGESNRLNGQTILRGRAISNLTIISDARGDTNGTALDLRVREGNPPMRVNSFDRVDGFNADLLDGKHAGSFVASSQVLFASVTSSGDLYGDGNAASAVLNGTGFYEVVFSRSTLGCAGTVTPGFSDAGAGGTSANLSYSLLMGTTWYPEEENVLVRVRNPSAGTNANAAFHVVIVCPPE